MTKRPLRAKCILFAIRYFIEYNILARLTPLRGLENLLSKKLHLVGGSRIY